MQTVSIEPLARGYLVTLWREDGGERYAEPDAIAAIHRAATLLDVEPATLYAEPEAPPLPPAAEALIERGESDDPRVGDLKAWEAVNA